MGAKSAALDGGLDANARGQQPTELLEKTSKPTHAAPVNSFGRSSINVEKAAAGVVSKIKPPAGPTEYYSPALTPVDHFGTAQCFASL